MPKRWFLGKGAQQFVVTRRRDLFPEEQMVLDPSTFSAHVERWISDTITRQTLLDLYESAGGGRVSAGPTHAKGNDLWPRVRRHLERAFRSGELVIISINKTVRVVEGREKPPPPPAPPEEVKSKTWIEIQLLDEDGLPMAKEMYKIKLPDGSFDEGFLDNQGRARVDGIDPGACQVSFPDLKPNTQPKGSAGKQGGAKK